jgi:hypothetical protein
MKHVFVETNYREIIEIILQQRVECFKKSLKIPKGGNQNPYIKEQTTQWPKKKYKMTNNDLQNIHIKLKIE